MRKLVLLIILALVGCKKKNPNPELLDPIYAEIQREIALAGSEVVAEVKLLEEHLANLKKVVPQTGQIKYAQKRVDESRLKIQKLKQKRQGLEYKLEARLKKARRDYSLAFAKGEPWPDPKEFEYYKEITAAQGRSRLWKMEDRLKQAGMHESQQPKTAGKEASGH